MKAGEIYCEHQKSLILEMFSNFIDFLDTLYDIQSYPVSPNNIKVGI